SGEIDLAPTQDTVLLIAADRAVSEFLGSLLEGAGYKLTALESAEGAAAILREGKADVLLLADRIPDAAIHGLLTSIQDSAENAKPRVLLITRDDPAQRALWLDQGADDVLSIPLEDQELLARVRAQLRQKRARGELNRKVRNAEESYPVAHTAFKEPATTEKMTKDAFSLERILKIGVGALFGLA